MPEKTMKLGFIGGAIDSAVGLTHKIASQMDGRWQLSAGCFSTNRDSNLETGQRWGIESARVYDSWQELLVKERGKLDAIAVLTPTPTHADIVKTAIEQGWPVICEKALSVSSQEIIGIQSSRITNQAFLAVTYNYTGYPMLRELKALIEKDKLGKINQVHIEMPQEGFLRLNKSGQKATPQDWRLSDGPVPTLSLDLGVHVHHIIKFLTNEKPLSVVTTNNTFGLFGNIIDNTLCIARYTNNLDCQIWFSKTALGHSNGLRVRVYGAKGSAEWFQMDSEVLILADNYGRKHRIERSCSDLEVASLTRYERFKAGHPAGFMEAFANHYYDIADALISFNKQGAFNSPWVFGTDDALEGLFMLEAMVLSAREKRWVDVAAMTK